MVYVKSVCSAIIIINLLTSPIFMFSLESKFLTSARLQLIRLVCELSLLDIPGMHEYHFCRI